MIKIYGKCIELFLVNGTSDSTITAELSNWNGMAVKNPRTAIQNYSRNDLNGTGVYFLFCQDDDGSDSVYIGESGNILSRLRQHLQDYKSGKEEFYWNTVVAFTSNKLNKALTYYLEDRLVGEANTCGRYKVLTKNTYTISKTSLTESQIASMEQFIDNIKLIIATLSYNIFAPVRANTNTNTNTNSDDTIYLYCKGSGASATGFASSGGFTVLKGSKTSANTVPSLNKWGLGYYNLRMKLEDDKTIIDGVFQRDYEFSSPSTASSVVRGCMSNGKTDWQTEDGTQLKNL